MNENFIVVNFLKKHLGVLKNSLRCIRVLQIELEFKSAGFWGEGQTGVPIQ